MIERRQSIRVDCELPSTLRNLEAGYTQQLVYAVVKNISRGGVRIRMDQFIPIQCHLHFYLQLPNHETIEVRLVPAWIVELPGPGKYEMGARFAQMSAEQEDAIQSFQYQALLNKIPPRSNSLKDLHKEPPTNPGLAA